MHGRDLKEKNSVENEFSMLITLEKVVLRILFRLKVKKSDIFKNVGAAILDLRVNDTSKYKKMSEMSSLC